jgi:hypothetical protein
MPQGIVVEFDQLGLSGATVDDAGCASGYAETAARTRPLLGALKSDEFHISLLKESTATSVTPVQKRPVHSDGSEPATIALIRRPS